MARKKNDLKSTAVSAVEGKVDNVVNFAITDEVFGFAAGLGIDLVGTLDDRADRAAEHMNRSQRHMLASGLLLASIKSDSEHGEFLSLIEERGFEQRAAYRAMQYAQFILSRPEAERELLIGLPKSKVLALAGADAEVIDAVLAGDGEASIDTLSVRALQDRIRELEAAAVDGDVQLQTAEADAAALREQLQGRAKRKDKVPLVVADLRAEIAEQTRLAQLAIGEFQPLGVEVVGLAAAGAQDWADATLRLAVAGLSALRLQIEGVLQKYLRELPDGEAAPVALSSFTTQEADEAQERFAVLIGAQRYSKELRQWEREQERPKGKGRPSAKPEAPKGGV
jgi:hypothetical protein